MAKSKADPHDILDKGIDFKTRTIFFGEDETEGAFNWSSVEDCIRRIHVLSQSAGTIHLHMSSEGGDVYEMLRLYDTISKCPVQVKFYGSGIVASAAVWIMSVCDERWLDPNTTVMIHHGESGSPSSFIDKKIDSDEYDRLMKRLMNLFVDNSIMPYEFWFSVCQRDTYLTPEECLTLGICDKISAIPKRGKWRKARQYAMANNMDKKEINKLVRALHKRIYKGKFNTLEIKLPIEEVDDTIDSNVGPAITEHVEVSPEIEKVFQENIDELLLESESKDSSTS